MKQLLAVVLLCSAALAQSPASVPTVQLDNPHRHLPAIAQEVVLPYWTLEPGWHTELQLRNNTEKKSITVKPALRTASGQEFLLPELTLSPEELRALDLSQATASAAPQLLGAAGSFGSLVIRYSAIAAKNLYASAVVHRIGQPISFHFDADRPDQQKAGGTWESIWWLPTETTESFLILSNTTPAPISAMTVITDSSGASHSLAAALGPQQTAKIDLKAAVAKAGISDTFGGVQVKFIGGLGEAVQFSYDEQVGFSKMMKVFYRPGGQSPESTTLRAPMVALSDPDPALQFPEGTRLKSQVLLRNASGAELPVAVELNWRSATGWGSAPISVAPLKPAETRILDLSALQKEGAIPAIARWANVNLTYSGQVADLIPAAASYGSNGQFMVQSPFSEQTSFLWKGSEWSVDTVHNSLITAGNGGAAPTQVAFRLFSQDGTFRYDLPDRTLAPGEQMWVNVGELIANQVPDKNGKTLPPDTRAGSYEIEDVSPRDGQSGRLYEGKLIVDKTYGHVTYGCALICCDELMWIELDPLDGGLPFQSQETGYAQDECAAEPRTLSLSNWYSSDTAIATVNSTGLVTGFAPGSTRVGGTASTQFEDYRGRCTWHNNTRSVPVNVGPFQVEPIATASQGPANCANQTQAGWVRNVTNQLQYATGTPYAVSGQTVADHITLSSRNDLGIAAPDTGQFQTTGDGSFRTRIRFVHRLALPVPAKPMYSKVGP